METEITYKTKKDPYSHSEFYNSAENRTSHCWPCFPRVRDLLGVFWQLVFLYTAHRFTDHESEGSMTPLIKTLQSVHPY